MRDVSNKPHTLRIAKARGSVHCSPETIAAIQTGNVPKADPLGVSKVAGIQAAKNTSLLIPYCHQVPLDYVGIEVEIKEASVHFFTEVRAVWKTGVEMEALTAASVAALTLYDMLKSIDNTLEIGSVRLIEKKGGRSDFKQSDMSGVRAAILVMSDKGASGERDDVSGKLIKERFEELGLAVVEYLLIPDEENRIRGELVRLCDEARVDLVMTTGGTGVSARDVTPEATRKILDGLLPGVQEVLRAHGQERNRYAMLSRGVAGLRGQTVVINLPGSPVAVQEALDILFPWVLHSFPMLKGGGH